MRVLLSVNSNRRLCCNKRLHKRIQQEAPPLFKLKQWVADGGYWRCDLDFWEDINNWLESNYKRKLTYYDGCLFPFLTK